MNPISKTDLATVIVITAAVSPKNPLIVSDVLNMISSNSMNTNFEKNNSDHTRTTRLSLFVRLAFRRTYQITRFLSDTVANVNSASANATKNVTEYDDVLRMLV